MYNIYGAAPGFQDYMIYVMLGLLVIVFIVLPMMGNRRKQKAFVELMDNVQPGCIIKTVSGLICKVISINEITPVDKEIVVESGVEGSKSTLVFDIQCVLQVIKLADGTPFIPMAMRARMAAAQAQSSAPTPAVEASADVATDPFETNASDQSSNPS